MLSFLKGAVDELKKLSAPSKNEIYIVVITVLISILVSSLVIMFMDFVISKVIKILFGLGI